MRTQITVNVPARLLKQYSWLRQSAHWVGRVTDALGAKVRNQPDGGTPQDAQMRVRLYALNAIGERLQVLLTIAEPGSERVQTALVRQLVEFVALGAYNEPFFEAPKGADTNTYLRRPSPVKW